MENQPRPNPATPDSDAMPHGATEERLAELAALIHDLDEHPAAPPAGFQLSPEEESCLVQVRLGVASGLYAALRAKHPGTAQHVLRVSLGCAAWATKIGLEPAQRDTIELAALLHDIGKIGVPDNVLLKPGQLSQNEVAVMDKHWQAGQEILRTCCVSSEVLDIVRYARCWYDGSRNRLDRMGDDLPVGSRMLAIVDAFDAMMTDQVYRRALSLERAYNELFMGAGRQFDPSLVMLFIKMYEGDQLRLQQDAMRRWLQELDPETANLQWQRSEAPVRGNAWAPDALFQQKLLDNMHDAVVFIDAGLRVVLWNRGAERLSGITAEGVLHRLFVPSLLRARDEKGRLIKDEECPVAVAIQTGVQWLRRLTIRGRGERELAVDAHAVPVMAPDGAILGLTLLLHDVSPEISLEEKCQNLHELATKDPLTQVANRAEFDRAHAFFIEAHRESKRPCSLIIADIDKFKSVNDTYGHQAGDEIIQSFAKLLKNSCRPGDLAGRYGGEEFVLLCADCDNATAAKRADEIRIAFGEIRQPSMDGRCVTASFGVTEVQPGDSPDTMLRRADRGLLLAKETGRNRVVQLGAGSDSGEESPAVASAMQNKNGHAVLSQDLVTQSPIDRSIEKLRGYIADQHGEITSIDSKSVQIKLGGTGGSFFRRSTDRQVRLIMDLRFEEERGESGDSRRGALTRTRVHVEIRPQRNRDRRHVDTLARARQVLISLRAYLMATEVAPKVEADLNLRSKGGGGLFGWFGKNKKPVDDR